jgi:hypothetical protein
MRLLHERDEEHSSRARNLTSLRDASHTIGHCMDYVRGGKSTIEHAGSGAFATRDFSSGSLITSSPLVQISNKTAMEIHSTNDGSNATQQLLFNYCFGHRRSPQLLCPTTQVALINHDPKRANVAIRWKRRSFSSSSKNDYTLEPVEELVVNNGDLASYNTRLVFEYVAIGDIKAGDELFLHYGEEWDGAMKEQYKQRMVKSEARCAEDRQSCSVEYPDSTNEENRTVAASDDVPNLQQGRYECLVYPNLRFQQTAGWEEFTANRNVADQEAWPEKIRILYRDSQFAAWYPCKVVKLDNERMVYNVETYSKPLGLNAVGRRYLNFPRDNIRFSEGPYQSDQHLAWSFRHYIPIPNSIFPLRWRDDYQPAAGLSLGRLDQVEATREHEEDYERSLRDVKCGLYIAKSNIPNAGTIFSCEVSKCAVVLAGSDFNFATSQLHNRVWSVHSG